MLPSNKRKQGTSQHNSSTSKKQHQQKAAPAGRQLKLTSLYGFQKERCPHCTAQFDTVQALIEHAEAAHFSGVDDDAAPQQPVNDAAPQQQPQQPWWKQAPSDPVVATIRYSSTNSSSSSPPPQHVRLSALASIAPMELVLQVLPGAFANSLLTELLAQSGGWVAGSWWFGGQQQTAPRSSATFSLQVSTNTKAGGDVLV